MSDEFDREEEKRKLREKYAKDRKDRETTGRMSDLLLQGATMTNKHCDRCGSPIFRQNDEEFCPTCRAEGNQPQTDESSPDSAEQPATAQTVATAEPDTTDETSNEAADAAPDASDAVRAPAPTTTTDRSEQTPADEPTQADEPTTQAATADTADLADARAALATSIETLARRAADTDDPHRATDYLEAAREAADTLRALDR